ncbi:MAG: glycosyltransferase [Flavobacteriaceae bacterium]|nr:glycosyltransferase [Flavobacteriaceae bacterium]
MPFNYSIIIPVYNRPQEVEELLISLTKQTFNADFEIVIVEDGSQITCQDSINKFKNNLRIQYYSKANSGPGLSRNFGMQKASGNYFIILDSDVIVPEHYLTEVNRSLQNNFTDAYGGADASHKSFSSLQKAINYSMTSLLTTGGIRGHKKLKRFQPRSFNMGLSKDAFESTGGFGAQHFGEDIDLTFRLWQNGYESQFIEKAFVYHKRRNTLASFFKQTFNFGAARPILNKQHPHTAKLTYWFPSLFVLGLLLSFVLYFFGLKWLLIGYGIYLIIIFLVSLFTNRNITVAIASILTTLLQFFGYGLGFLQSIIRLSILRKSKEQAFPRMFR